MKERRKKRGNGGACHVARFERVRNNPRVGIMAERRHSTTSFPVLPRSSLPGGLKLVWEDSKEILSLPFLVRLNHGTEYMYSSSMCVYTCIMCIDVHTHVEIESTAVGRYMDPRRVTRSEFNLYHRTIATRIRKSRGKFFFRRDYHQLFFRRNFIRIFSLAGRKSLYENDWSVLTSMSQ